MAYSKPSTFDASRSRIHQQMNVLGHVDKGDQREGVPHRCPIDASAERFPPNIVCQQRQTMIAGEGQLVAVAWLVEVPDEFSVTGRGFMAFEPTRGKHGLQSGAAGVPEGCHWPLVGQCSKYEGHGLTSSPWHPGRLPATVPTDNAALEALLPDRWGCRQSQASTSAAEGDAREAQARRRRRRAARCTVASQVTTASSGSLKRHRRCGKNPLLPNVGKCDMIEHELANGQGPSYANPLSLPSLQQGNRRTRPIRRPDCFLLPLRQYDCSAIIRRCFVV